MIDSSIGKGRLLLSAPLVLPEGVSRSFTIINNIHWLWRLCWIGKRTQEKSVCTFIATTGFSLLAGDNKAVQKIAKFVLATKRLLNCVDGCADLYYASLKFNDVLRGHYPIYEAEEESLEISGNWILLTDFQPYKTSLVKMAHYVMEVANGFFELLRCLFTLSMLSLDAIDAFYLSPSSQEESIIELGPNFKEVVVHLAEDSGCLLAKLKAHQQLMGWIINEGRAGFTIDQVINAVEILAKGTENVKEVVESVNLSGSHLIDGIGSSIEGLRNWSWNTLVNWVEPVLRLPASPEKNEGERFPPKNLVTRLDKICKSHFEQEKHNEGIPLTLSEKKMKRLKATLYPP